MQTPPGGKNLTMEKVDQKQSPSHAEKTLSVRIPEEKHRALKGRCVAEGVTIRAVLLALISELEDESPTATRIIDGAIGSDKNATETIA